MKNRSNKRYYLNTELLVHKYNIQLISNAYNNLKRLNPKIEILIKLDGKILSSSKHINFNINNQLYKIVNYEHESNSDYLKELKEQTIFEKESFSYDKSLRVELDRPIVIEIEIISETPDIPISKYIAKICIENCIECKKKFVDH
jgi:ABC-type microcin C transport system permease subunit YejE